MSSLEMEKDEELAPQPVAEPGPPKPAGPHPKRRRRLGLAVFAIVVLSAIGGALILGPRLKSPAQVVADAAPPKASVVTASVEERRLTEPVVLRGKVKPGPSLALRAPAAAAGESSVVTSVAVRKGDRLREGQVLLVRSGEPMLVFRMPFALYRDLAPGVTGPDVEAVQQVLRRLGYRTGARGKFDAATQSAVKRLYRDRGHRVPQAASGQETGGQDDQDQDQEEGGQRSEPRTTSPRPSPGQGPTLPRSGVVQIRDTGQLITKVKVKVGSVLSDASRPLMELDGGNPFLETLAGADQVNLLRKGQQAAVTDDVAGRTAKARVTTIGTSVVNGEESEQSGFRIRLAFTGRALEPAEDRTVRIDVGAAEGTGKVLAVPVTAIFSRPDGGTYVSVSGGGRRTDVAVTAGKMAGGWVEIKDAVPDVLEAGVQVVVSEGNLGGPRAGN